jgi:hypothetical protein
MPRIALAILDTMWGTVGRAPHWFVINPQNASGRRLYRLTGVPVGALWITNACPERTGHAAQHGTPSVARLRRSLALAQARWPRATLLVCGNVAQATYDALVVADGTAWRGPVMRMKHPAARTWTKAELARAQRRVQRHINR